MKIKILPIFLIILSAALFSGVKTFSQTPTPVPPPNPENKDSKTATPTPAPTPPPMPDFMQRPDYKASMAAFRERDVKKQIPLLEKFLVDFPDSANVTGVNQALLDAFVRTAPNDKEKIHQQALKTFESIKTDSDYSPINFISSRYSMIVSSLYRAEMNDQAEEIAQKSIAIIDEMSVRQMLASKTPIWLSLGQVYLKKGDYKKAESYFNQSLKGNAEGNTAYLGLAEIAEKRKKRKQQLDYLMQADSRGSLKKEQYAKLEEIYAKEKGSPAELKKILDANYKKLNPPPISIVKYTPTAKRTKRTVLAELFTGSACQPCVTVDLGFDALVQRYNPAEIAVLVYHLHVPGPDPMTNPATVARSKFYQSSSTPTYFINGTDRNTGGGINRKQAAVFYDKITPKIDTQLEKSQDADLNLNALMENDVVKANVNFDGLNGDSKGLKLNIALVEHEVRYMGENGIRFHQMVVREFGGDKREGFLLKDKRGKIEWTFDLRKVSDELKTYLDNYEIETKKDRPDFAFTDKKYQLDTKNLAVVAFIQDEKTKAILQSVFFDLAAGK